MACAVKERMGWAIRAFHSTDKFGGPLMRIRPIALCLGVAVTPSFALTAYADAGYNVTVLQDVGGQGFNLAQGINAFGQTVGYSSTTIGYDAVLWSLAGKATVLQDAGGGSWSLANAINNAGWSVGFSLAAPDDYSRSDAVLWSPLGKATVLHDGAVKAIATRPQSTPSG
jgi:hypothetical protein